jgi:hypothetical protein
MLDLPTPEQLDNLIQNDQLYVPLPPPATSPEVAVLTTALTPIVTLRGSHPLNIQPLIPVTLTTIAAAVASGSNPPVLAPPALPAPIIPPSVVPLVPVLPVHPPTMTTPLRGVPPSVFDGTRHKSESFLREFKRYQRLNRTNDIMTNPYNRVIIALSYIKGPNIDTWVDTQETALDTRVNANPPVPDTEEIHWTTFEAAFKNAWKDSAKVQTAYKQLMQLTMKGDDIDTYIAAFDRLVLAAEWELTAKGTLAHFRRGLEPKVHRHALQCDTLPTTMDQWKDAICKEISRSCEICNSGLPVFGQQTKNPNFGQYQSTCQNPPPPRTNTNNQVVPMDVDTTIFSTVPGTPFKKLTEEEQVKYMAEGHCFRCRQQGHMARQCPLNTKPQPNSPNSPRTTTACATEDEPAISKPDTPITTLPTPPQGRTILQQIADLKGQMTEEEHRNYLDARDMNEGFCDAEL